MKISPRTIRRRHQDSLVKEWRAILLRDPCVYCGAPADGLDHIRPRAAGGSNGWENRAPACADCDAAKSANALIGFLLGVHVAIRTVERRTRYESQESRRDAIERIRDNIAQQFYSGNIRWSQPPTPASVLDDAAF